MSLDLKCLSRFVVPKKRYNLLFLYCFVFLLSKLSYQLNLKFDSFIIIIDNLRITPALTAQQSCKQENQYDCTQ